MTFVTHKNTDTINMQNSQEIDLSKLKINGTLVSPAIKTRPENNLFSRKKTCIENMPKKNNKCKNRYDFIKNCNEISVETYTDFKQNDLKLFKNELIRKSPFHNHTSTFATDVDQEKGSRKAIYCKYATNSSYSNKQFFNFE